MNKRYGEEEIKSFCIEKDLTVWDNNYSRAYEIRIVLPEFTCLCPRSGYPDFASIYLEYIPNKYVVELKALKLFINTFKDQYISHEDSINTIYDILNNKLSPKFIKIVGEFNPRGNVSTKIEVNSDLIQKYR